MKFKNRKKLELEFYNGISRTYFMHFETIME